MWADRPSRRRIEACWDALRPHLEIPAGTGAAADAVTRIRLRASGLGESLAAGLIGHPGATWLDDGESGRQLIACDPLLWIRAVGSRTEVSGPGAATVLDDDLFLVLEALALGLGGRYPTLRLFGYLGYELGSLLESLPAAPARAAALPDAWLGLHAAWIESSGVGAELVVSARWHTPDEAERLAAAVDEGALGSRPPWPGPGARTDVEDWGVVPADREFEAAVAHTVERIVAGEIFQTNLCRAFSIRFDPRGRGALYRRLRAANPARYGAYLELGDGAVLSMSPECFLRCRAGQVESEPIKGTRARSGDPVADTAAAASLRGSEKDAAELAMIVDLVRNDLGRVCEPGSVRVLDHARLMSLPTVLHTVSTVAGRLRSDASWIDLLRATFPAGSITGAPKIAAMRVALDYESVPRGPSMGSIGWIALGGDLELSVAIRTAVVADGTIVYHAGCGVVAGSDPGAERRETQAKARAFLEAFE